nr:V-type ATP synthase subunit E family protein [Candidatus Njordarchaeota archaeon]
MSKAETAEPIESKIEKMEVVGEAERLKKIARKIIGEAEEKAKSLLKEAEKIRKDILEQKRKEGEGEAEKTIRSGMEEADSLKRQRVAEARLKAKQMIIAAREDLINEALEKCKQKLSELTTSKDYGKILGKLVEEGGIGLGGGELEIIVPTKDQKTTIDISSIAKRVEKETGNKTTINMAQGKLRSIGGVVVRKSDGSIVIDNTFDARIERVLRDIRMQTAKVLFE